MQDKNILLAITGSIAAYKAAHLTRLLIKEGCSVKVLMTEAATAFISPLTLSTLSRNPVHTTIISEEEWNNHVDLGLWADVMLIAPATANTLSKCACGQADNIVVATYLSARSPVFFAPAMDLDMWAHGSTKDNLDALRKHGDHIIPVGTGELASGLEGEGRMAEPEDIVHFIKHYFSENLPLYGKRAIVTAGPTHEAIDPVRYIGNRSTGTMGVAVANALHAAGAVVDLVLGPSHVIPKEGVRVHRVVSAQDMYEKAIELFPDCDIAVLAAAVADYTPVNPSEQKIKKESGVNAIEIKRTPDIALELSRLRSDSQFVVGFALETDNELANAQNKLEKKRFDFIVLNSLQNEGAGFGTSTNQVNFVFPSGEIKEFDLKSKTEVAGDIVEEIQRNVVKEA
jgi:phosphopantothenoylcysteine decarboxylase/phosphopantothenate--cysteine ligase